MTERLISLFILLGIVLAFLALWYLSYRLVWWDTRRRGLRPAKRKAWIAQAIILPLFGCALYFIVKVLQCYLKSPSEEHTSVPGIEETSLPTNSPHGGVDDPAHEQKHRHSEDVLRQAPVLEPAWGNTQPARSNGKAHAFRISETVQAPYQVSPTRYALVVVEGPLQGQEFPVLSLPLRIGRGGEAGIALDADLNVSRKHAEIYEWNGRLRIRDLGSMHGILVNGVAIKIGRASCRERA
jgi:hypothetical protein